VIALAWLHDTPWEFKIWIFWILRLNREFAKGVSSWNMAVLYVTSLLQVWYFFPCVHECPSLIRFIPDGLLKIGHLRLQNLVSYPCGRKFEKRWKLTSALVILNGSMVVNL